MTRYSRSVIPGRPNGEGGAHDVDALVFGKKRGANPSAANDEDDDLGDSEAVHLVDRAASDRRKGARRRKSDFAPLPQEGRGYRAAQEGSKRGPILLVGALIIVGVFGVVVWNAYRDGVRPEDSAATPVLAEAGAFKTKPDTAKASDDVEASVFDQVEAPKAAIVPAPEVRESAFVLPPHTPQVTPSAPAAATPAPAPATPPPSTTSTKPPVQTAATTAKPSAQTATAAAKPAPAQPAAPPPKSVVTAAKPTATQAPAVTPSPPPATTAVPPPLQTAAAPAPKSEAIQLAGAYTPSFAADGKYIVQVAAASSEEGANAEWAKRAKAAPDLFGAAEKFVVQADVNGRTVYRLRAGSFATSAEADAFCTAYKARGGACFRTAK